MQDQLVQYTAGPFAAPFAIQGLLADTIVAANLPYEGLWTPVKFAKAASVELFGSQSTLGLDIWATNRFDPVNTYTVTVGGSETDGDVLNLIFANPLLPNGTETVSVTTAGGETLTAIAAALAAAVNADAALSPLGFKATSAAAVATITWPSLPGFALPVTEEGSPPIASTTILTTSKSGGASETLTVAVGADGFKLNGSTLAALGLTNFTSSMPVAYIKARIGTLTGTNANISVALAAAA